MAYIELSVIYLCSWIYVLVSTTWNCSFMHH